MSAQALRDSKRVRWSLRLVLPTVLVGILGVLVVRPLVDLYTLVFQDDAAGLRRLFDLPDLAGTVWTTLYLATASTVVALVLGVGLATCARHIPGRARRYFAVVPILPIVIPGVSFVIGWSFLLSPRSGYINQLLRSTWLFDDLTEGPVNVYTPTAIAVITGLNLAAFVYIFARVALEGLPDELEAAGLACGASRRTIFFRITLPLLRPAIVYSGGIAFLLGLGQFHAPLLLGSRSGVKVLTTEIFYLKQRYPIDYALGAALGVPILTAGVAILVVQRILLRKRARFAVGGGRTDRPSVKSSRWAILPVMLYGLLTVLLPLLALLHVALSTYWTGDLSFGDLTFNNFRDVLIRDDAAREAVWNSVRFSGLAVALVVPLTFLVVVCLQPWYGAARLLRGLLSALSSMPLAVPSALMGFALLGAYAQRPFVLYGTSAAVIVTYVTLMIPYGVRTQSAEMLTRGTGFFEAGRVCGASDWRILLRIALPLARASIAGGIAIMFVLLSHEFSASLMVRSPRADVIGTVLYDRWGTGNYPAVAVLALVMVVVTTIGVAAALAISGERALADV